MIFLTVGTQLPFDRLVKTVDAWCGARGFGDVFGQIADPGPQGYRPQNFQWAAHIPPAKYREAFAAADLIVAHAGMGSIITAMSLSKPILILPRRSHLHEHRNDHQFATVSHLKSKPGVVVALNEDDLTRELDRLTAMKHGVRMEKIEPFAQTRLIEAVRDLIKGS